MQGLRTALRRLGPIAPHSHDATEVAIGMPSSQRVQFGRRGGFSAQVPRRRHPDPSRMV